MPGMDPMMMGMMPPPEPPPIDPMDPNFDAGLVPDDVLDDILIEMSLPPVGPELPIGYKKPKKPKASEVLEAARRDESQHQLWLQLVAHTLARLRGEVYGYFEGDEEKIENNTYEIVRAPDLVAQHHALCRHIAQMQTSYDCPAHDVVDKEESSAKEEALSWWRRKEAEQHEDWTGQDINWAEADVLAKYGVIIGIDKLAPDRPEGLAMRLLDPGTTFPTYGGDRLHHVTRLYRCTVEEAVGMFGHHPGAEAKITSKKGSAASAERTEEIDVIEWIDEWWHAAYVNDEEVFCAAHEYGECPVEVYYLPYGEQNFTQTPAPTDRTLAATTPEELMVWAAGGSFRQLERRRRALPFAFHQFRSHDLKEAMQGVAVTLFKRMRDPAWILNKDPFADVDPIDEVRTDGNVINEIGKDETLAPIPVEVQPPLVAYVTAMVAQNEAMVGLPAQMQGSMQGIGTQTTGSAIDLLNSAGAEQFWPVAHALGRFRARRGARRLRLFADWEPLIGSWGNRNRGGLTVPRRGGPPLRLTRAAVLRSGIEVEATLNRFDLTRSAQAATVAQILSSGGLAPKVTLIEHLGYTTDPDEALAQIAEEQFMEVPEIAQIRLAQWLIDRIAIAKQRGDDDSRKIYEGWYAWISQAIDDQRMARLKMSGRLAGAAPEDAPQPGLPDGDAEGLSQPAYGHPSGTEGGRPPMPPPQMMGGGF